MPVHMRRTLVSSRQSVRVCSLVVSVRQSSETTARSSARRCELQLQGMQPDGQVAATANNHLHLYSQKTSVDGLKSLVPRDSGWIVTGREDFKTLVYLCFVCINWTNHGIGSASDPASEPITSETFFFRGTGSSRNDGVNQRNRCPTRIRELANRRGAST